MLKKMLKSKKFKVCAILLICYIFGASIIYAIFYRMQHNPTDQAAMPYIWEDKSFENQYGKVEHVGRNFKYKTKETDNEKKVSYGVETDKYHAIVYVTLEKNGEELKPVEIEILEVENIGTKD